jgi:CRP-like cAMP-binding protein
MANPLTMKLEQFVRFDQHERQRLDRLLHYPTNTYARGEALIREGEKVRDIYLVLTGLAPAPRRCRMATGRSWPSSFLGTCAT